MSKYLCCSSLWCCLKALFQTSSFPLKAQRGPIHMPDIVFLQVIAIKSYIQNKTYNKHYNKIYIYCWQTSVSKSSIIPWNRTYFMSVRLLIVSNMSLGLFFVFKNNHGVLLLITIHYRYSSTIFSQIISVIKHHVMKSPLNVMIMVTIIDPYEGIAHLSFLMTREKVLNGAELLRVFNGAKSYLISDLNDCCRPGV